MVSLLFFLVTLCGIISSEHCGYDGYRKKILDNDVDGSIHRKLDNIERNAQSEHNKHIHAHQQRRLQEGITDDWDGLGFSTSDYFEGILEIPVIVHVLYNSTLNNIYELVTHERIQSQLLRLNIDFLGANDDELVLNWESIKANYNMSFKLCEIRRVETSQAELDLSDATAISPPYQAHLYLNLYVAQLAASLLGVCTFPSTPDDRDACAVTTKAFGDKTFKYINDNDWKADIFSSFDSGKTETHEVGHWFFLEHTFSGGCASTDKVLDTPPQESYNFGCPSPITDFSQKESCGTTDMYMNYMDYSDDRCLLLFTNGQLERSLSIFSVPSANGGRKELTDYQDSTEYTEGTRYVNDVYFRELLTDETDENIICGPTDHLIYQYGRIDGNYYVYACATSTNNKYVDVINCNNFGIRDSFNDNEYCLQMVQDGENNQYLCYTKVPFTDTTNRITVDELITKFNESALSTAPTSDPTSGPTADPTISPTIDPTTNPIIDPTSEPTSDPTARPTTSPITTSGPTSDPTPVPSSDPTRGPTTDPSTAPTGGPSVDPTVAPSVDPTADPTTDNPTTALPTNNPTAVIPTTDPTTAAPTIPQTSNPTADLTHDPSAVPTAGPTTGPTVDPTTGPTNGPSADPTTSPTSSPTFDPTTYPTANPSARVLTDNPSRMPSSHPVPGYNVCKRGPCRRGYFDRTGGNYQREICGRRCRGGKYYTDGNCNCACAPRNQCESECQHNRGPCKRGYEDITDGNWNWRLCGRNCPGGRYYTDDYCNCACQREPDFCSDGVRCYDQGPCDSGYMDKTGGHYRWQRCGRNCEGGNYLTDGSCGCACVDAGQCALTPNYHSFNFYRYIPQFAFIRSIGPMGDYLAIALIIGLLIICSLICYKKYNNLSRNKGNKYKIVSLADDPTESEVENILIKK